MELSKLISNKYLFNAVLSFCAQPTRGGWTIAVQPRRFFNERTRFGRPMSLQLSSRVGVGLSFVVLISVEMASTLRQVAGCLVERRFSDSLCG